MISAEKGIGTIVAAVPEHPELVGGRNVALVISGGNIDKDLMLRLLNE